MRYFVETHRVSDVRSGTWSVCTDGCLALTAQNFFEREGEQRHALSQNVDRSAHRLALPVAPRYRRVGLPALSGPVRVGLSAITQWQHPRHPPGPVLLDVEATRSAHRSRLYAAVAARRD